MISQIIIDIFNLISITLLGLSLILLTVVTMTVLTRKKMSFRVKDTFALEVDAEQK